jgi:glycosyltransferase involved in cell wall biosynthesis
MGARIQELGVPVHALNMRTGVPGPAVFARLRRIVCSFKPNIVQGWMYHGNLAASLAGRFARGRPAVVWNIRHSLYNLSDEKPLTRQVIRGNRWFSGGIDNIIYNSHVSRRQHEAFGFSHERGVVIPNGFDLVRLFPDEEAALAVRKEFGISHTALLIGHVARFHPMKDHASFLRAAVRIATAMPTVRFLLVGREVSPDNESLADIVPAELLSRFVFTGERRDAQRLMQAMDVLVMSSAWGEGFPNVLGEAMASGVSCVATDVGDSADIIGDTGILVTPADSEALAQGLFKMLGKSPEERRALGRTARDRVERHYGLDSVVSQYITLYEALAGRKVDDE